MSPVEYLQRYYQLQIPEVVDETVMGWKEVKLNRYVLVVKLDKDTGAITWDKEHPGNQAAYDAMLGKLWEHFGKKGATLKVHITRAVGGLEPYVFDNWKAVWYYARKAFVGKGTPEEAQITLQLAARFKLLEGCDMQGYCNKYLGLDCNGFVGNYLVHGLRKGDWRLAEPPGGDFLANKTVGVIMRGNGTAITDLDELLRVNAYMMGLVGTSGQVIERVEGDSFAHIFITKADIKWETGYQEGKTVRQVPTMLAIESTGGVGLIMKECQIVSAKNGVFTVKRLSHPSAGALKFRAFRVRC